MTVLFDDELHVHYGYFFLLPRTVHFVELHDAITGQANGLLGAAVPHALWGTTGLHTGRVPIQIEWHETAPPLTEGWEDIVEASVEFLGTAVHMVTFDQAHSLDLPAPGWLRARYHVTGMDAGHQQDTVLDDEIAPDRYLLQLWPAPPQPDLVVRQHSEQAAYWHREARSHA